jgi:hypothetical protein
LRASCSDEGRFRRRKKGETAEMVRASGWGGWGAQRVIESREGIRRVTTTTGEESEPEKGRMSILLPPKRTGEPGSRTLRLSHVVVNMLSERSADELDPLCLVTRGQVLHPRNALTPIGRCCPLYTVFAHSAVTHGPQKLNTLGYQLPQGLGLLC